MARFRRVDLLAAHQCARRLWLQSRPGEGERAGPRADDRDMVRVAARRRFPGGVAVDQRAAVAERVAQTWALLERPEVPAIFDATMVYADVVVRCAILARVAGGFVVVEAKSANSVGEAHELDVAASAWVAERAGVPIVGRQLLHLDGNYVRGAELDEQALFSVVNVPAHDFAAAAAKLAALDVCEPEIAVGLHCTRPRECPWRDHCAPRKDTPTSVHRLPRGGKLAQDLAGLGIDDVRDIPRDVRLNPSQQHAVWALLHDREYIGQGLAPALRNVRWPLRFLDFEACQPAVPRWPETSPFQQVPTQWSMHVEHADGRVEHLEFLHDTDSDPREPFVRSLVEACGSEGSIVVYSGYEANTLRGLRDRIPEAWADLEGLVGRIWDLLPAVRDHYYHPALDGSFSIKAVLPAVCPHLDYRDLRIADGMTAAAAWLRMIGPRTPPEERAVTRADLLAYCARDTLAMLEVRKALVARSGG